MAKITKKISNNWKRLRSVMVVSSKRQFLQLHPRDQAEYVRRQKQSARRRLYNLLTPKQLAEMFEYMDLKDRVWYFQETQPERAASIIACMYVDDAVDLLRLLERDKSAQYIERLEDDLAQDIHRLLHYEEKTAGSIMTTEFIAVAPTQTANDALKLLKQQANDVVTIYYVFVIDERDKLVKVVSLKELLVARKDRLIGQLGGDTVVSVHAEESEGEAAKLMQDYNFLALPVVDVDGRLLGVITIDDIVDVIDEMAADRYSQLAAVNNIELTDGPFLSARKRLPWLILLLFLGMITATLIGSFEDTIAQVAILGAFIPVVAGTTGNSGTQSLAIVVRGIATGKIEELSLRRYFAKEFVTALITSIVCGVVLTAIVYVWKQELFIGLVAGVSLTFSILAGTLVGSAVPLALQRMRVDPAVASGPLITTVCDIFSMGIYFGIATLLMSQLV